MTNNQNTSRAIEARRAYYKRWRAANKERVRAYNEAYWLRKGEQLEREANGEQEDK